MSLVLIRPNGPTCEIGGLSKRNIMIAWRSCRTPMRPPTRAMCSSRLARVNALTWFNELEGTDVMPSSAARRQVTFVPSPTSVCNWSMVAADRYSLSVTSCRNSESTSRTTGTPELASRSPPTDTIRTLVAEGTSTRYAAPHPASLPHVRNGSKSDAAGLGGKRT